MIKLVCKRIILLCLAVLLSSTASTNAYAGDRDGVGGYKFKVDGEGGDDTAPGAASGGLAGTPQEDTGALVGRRGQAATPQTCSAPILPVHRMRIWLEIARLVWFR